MSEIVASPDKRPKVIHLAERWIPLAWLAMLSSEDVKANPDCVFRVDRREAIVRGESNVPFLAEVFPDLPVAEATEEFFDQLRRMRSGMLGIDLSEASTVQPPEPNLGEAVAAIEERNRDFSIVVPGRQGVSPVDGTPIEIAPIPIASTAEMLLRVCWLTSTELESFDDDDLCEVVVGHAADS